MSRQREAPRQRAATTSPLRGDLGLRTSCVGAALRARTCLRELAHPCVGCTRLSSTCRPRPANKTLRAVPRPKMWASSTAARARPATLRTHAARRLRRRRKPPIYNTLLGVIDRRGGQGRRGAQAVCAATCVACRRDAQLSVRALAARLCGALRVRARALSSPPTDSTRRVLPLRLRRRERGVGRRGGGAGGAFGHVCCGVFGGRRRGCGG